MSEPITACICVMDEACGKVFESQMQIDELANAMRAIVLGRRLKSTRERPQTI